MQKFKNSTNSFYMLLNISDEFASDNLKMEADELANAIETKSRSTNV